MSTSNGRPSRLSSAQVFILQTLAKLSDGASLTRQQLEAKGEVATNSANLGPAQQERLEEYPLSLYARGLVRPQVFDINNRDTILWQITPRGRRIAEKSSACRPPASSEKIPSDLLDSAVKAVRSYKSYGLERFSPTDLLEVQSLLGESYAHVSSESLKQQIVNRRKQGAYATPADAWPEWYVAYRASQHWQAVVQEVKDCQPYCSLNHDHTDSLAVYHSNLQRIGSEEVEDLVVLCKDCFKRCRKSLPVVSVEDPF